MFLLWRVHFWRFTVYFHAWNGEQKSMYSYTSKFNKSNAQFRLYILYYGIIMLEVFMSTNNSIH